MQILKRLTGLEGLQTYYKVSVFVNSFLATLLIVLGYIVAPVLFNQLNSKLAGDIAGQLFNTGATVAVSLLLGLLFWRKLVHANAYKIWPSYVVLVILMVLLFVIAPWMNEIKALYPLGISQQSTDWPLFFGLHGFYQLSYLIVIAMLFYSVIKTFTLFTVENIE